MKKSKKTKQAGKTAISAPSGLFNKIYTSIIIVLACSVALAMMPQAYNYVLIKLAIAQFLLIIIFVLWFCQTLEKGEITIYKDPSFIALAALTVWLIINLFYSSFMHASIRELSRLLTCFFLYFAVANLVKREKDLIGIVIVIVIIFAGLSVHGIFDHFHGKHPVIISTFGNPNFFSAYLVTIFPIALLLGIYNFSRKNFLVSSLLFILTAITIFLLHVLKSRGAWLALIVSLVFLLILFRKHIFSPKWRTYILIGCLVIIFIGSGLLIQKMPQIKSYLDNEMTRGTVGIRLHIWHGTLKMIQARPLLGWGMGTFIIVYPRFRILEYFLNQYSVNATDHAHNEILEITSEIGLIGLAIFFLFLGIIFYRGIRTFNRQTLDMQNFIHAGLLAGVIALLAHNMTCVNLRLEASAIYLYLFLGLIAAGCKLQKGYLSDKDEKSYFNKKFATNKILPWIIVPIAAFCGMVYTNETVKLIRSSVYLKKAVVFRNQNKWNESIREYNKSIYWNKYNLRSYYRLAYAYAATGDMEKALDTYSKLEKFAPDYADIHYNMGTLYLKTEQMENAKQKLQRAIELNPYEPRTHCNLGAVYMHLGDTDKALDNYQLSVEVQELKKEINPGLEDFGGGYAGMAEVYYYKQQWDKAAENYIKAMQSGEKNVRILTRLGNCYLNMGDFAMAKQTYEEALRIDPSQTQIRELLNKIIKSSKNGNQ